MYIRIISIKNIIYLYFINNILSIDLILFQYYLQYNYLNGIYNIKIYKIQKINLVAFS